jgi:hypothetical protein
MRRRRYEVRGTKYEVRIRTSSFVPRHSYLVLRSSYLKKCIFITYTLVNIVSIVVKMSELIVSVARYLCLEILFKLKHVL